MTVNVWDSKPHTVDYHGQTIEVFYRSALAKALNRAIVTIRSMEAKGVISTPRLRDGANRWLYTREQIEAMVELAREEGVLDPRYRRPFTQRFIDQAHAILNRLPS